MNEVNEAQTLFLQSGYTMRGLARRMNVSRGWIALGLSRRPEVVNSTASKQIAEYLHGRVAVNTKIVTAIRCLELIKGVPLKPCLKKLGLALGCLTYSQVRLCYDDIASLLEYMKVSEAEFNTMLNAIEAIQ